MRWIFAFLITLPVLAEDKRPTRRPASIEKEVPVNAQEQKKEKRYKEHLFNQVQETPAIAQDEER